MGRSLGVFQPEGRLSHQLACYAVGAGSFHQGWEEFIPQQRLLEYGEGYDCGACDLRAACAQCPALAQLEQGDPEKRVEFLCQVAHQRRDAFANDLFS